MAARKARKLPFVVQPRLKPIQEEIGSEESGKFVIERRGYLSVSEKAWVQGAEEGDDATSLVHSLAIRIGGSLNKDPKEVLNDIGAGNLSEDLAPYAEDIMGAMSKVAAFNERHQLIVATCMMVSRVDPQWTVEDTLALHPDHLDALNLLYAEEEAKSLDALEAASERDEHDDQKLAPGKD